MKIVYSMWLWCEHLRCDWPGVGGNGRTLSGGQRRVTITVAGNGIDVPPLAPAFVYGTGSCLFGK